MGTGKLMPRPLLRICRSYVAALELFDRNKKGKSMAVDRSGTICSKICIMNSRSGANTVYGSRRVDISVHHNVRLYRWTFVIMELRVNMLIGIDSNPIFMRSDFSNYFRSFGGNQRDI